MGQKRIGAVMCYLSLQHYNERASSYVDAISKGAILPGDRFLKKVVRKSFYIDMHYEIREFIVEKE